MAKNAVFSTALVALMLVTIADPASSIVYLGDPAVSSWGNNRFDFFIWNFDNTLWTRSWNGSAWIGSWEYLGIATSSPSAVSWGYNRIDVFARGTDNALWHIWWDGRWNNWVYVEE